MLEWIEPTEAAWQTLPGGPEARDPETGEAWQYMGPEQTEHGTLVYCFRHRNHPSYQQRIYWRVPVTNATD